ncbi:MAG: P-II family nitrogen regulator [Anaeroplasmataceae bacterium]|nr:P-II family nitrogen regulator [Anaeroplasmataceae bacterium]
MEGKFEVIFCIVDAGFSDSVMSAARECGARGGTVLNARGTAREDAEKLFNISIQPEKEIVLILVNDEIKDDILHAIYKNVGLNTPAQGIAFSLPVDEVVGLSSAPINAPAEGEKKEENEAN